MKEEDKLIDELNDIKAYLMFQVNGDDPEYGDDDLINGDCWHLTSALYHETKIKGIKFMKLINPCESQGENQCMVEHWFIYYNGKYYDGWNTEGVNKVSELEYCIRNYLADFNEFLKDMLPDDVTYEKYCDMCAIEDKTPDKFTQFIPRTGQAKKTQDWFEKMVRMKKQLNNQIHECVRKIMETIKRNCGF